MRNQTDEGEGLISFFKTTFNKIYGFFNRKNLID